MKYNKFPIFFRYNSFLYLYKKTGVLLFHNNKQQHLTVTGFSLYTGSSLFFPIITHYSHGKPMKEARLLPFYRRGKWSPDRTNNLLDSNLTALGGGEDSNREIWSWSPNTFWSHCLDSTGKQRTLGQVKVKTPTCIISAIYWTCSATSASSLFSSFRRAISLSFCSISLWSYVT